MCCASLALALSAALSLALPLLPTSFDQVCCSLFATLTMTRSESGHVQGALSFHRILGRHRTLGGFGQGSMVQTSPFSEELPALVERLFDDGSAASTASADEQSAAGANSEAGPALACKPIKPRFSLDQRFFKSKVDRSASALWYLFISRRCRSVVGQFEGEWKLSESGADALQVRAIDFSSSFLHLCSSWLNRL